MVPRASYDCHFMSRLVHVAHFCATALPLFEEEAQYERLPRARAAGCGRSVPYERALREREAALLWWKAVFLRVSLDAHFVNWLVHVAHFCATALPLSG